MRKIILTNSQRDLPLSLPKVRKAVSFLLQELNISDQVILNFVSEPKICKLHKEFFNDPTSTDCMTFPLHSEGILGEAFICPKVACDYAKKNKIDPYEEFLRYIVHCLLHMIGYEDTSAAKKAKMKRKENSCLKKLLKKN